MDITMNKVKKFQEISSEIVEKIISSGGKLDTLFSDFIRKYYALLPIERLEAQNPEHLLNIAKESFSFFTSREINPKNINSSKVRIFSPEAQSPASKYSVIELVIDNMPFLIDSLKEELLRQEIKIHEIIHPVFDVIRDNQGKLISIEKNSSSKRESLIRLHIDKIKQEYKFESLEQSLKEIILNVTHAVDDWKNMVNAVDETIKGEGHNQNREILEWIKDDHFTFLGFGEYHLDYSKNNFEQNLGILKIKNINLNDKISEEILKFTSNLFKITDNSQIVEIAKINLISPVHRNANLDSVAIRIYDNNKNLTSIKIFIGMFTSVLYYQSVNSIPIIRDKTKYVMEQIGFESGGYSNKELSTILESLPREELFQIEQNQLYEMALSIYSAIITPELKLFIRHHICGESLSCLIFIPRDRYVSEIKEKTQEMLNKYLGNGIVVTHDIQTTHLPMNCLYSIFTPEEKMKSIDSQLIEKMENELKQIVKFWKEDLKTYLDEHLDGIQAKFLHKKYKKAFPIAYQENFPPSEQVLKDINLIEESLENNQPIFDLYQDYSDKDNNKFVLSVYSLDRKILLSEMMPIFDCMGFAAIDEDTYYIKVNKFGPNIWLHNFHLNIASYHTTTITSLKDYEVLAATEIKTSIEEALEQIWCKNLQNDSLNKLILRAGMSWRQVLLVRVLSRYIRQIGFTYSSEYIENVVTSYPRLTALMFDLFYELHCPEIDTDNQEKIAKINDQINEKLTKVVSSAEDKIIRRFFDVIRAILRSNYFQKDENGNYKEYISIKINSSLIAELPKPVPFREIFVYSNRFEAIHLRGGPVARGGLRWSDRSEDFRTEVLGLMKAQMTKNSVIIPVGSKGGFVIKQSISMVGREEYLKEGIRCYELFLKGLLDITDNIVDGKIIHPENMVRHDSDDPYLVVAADKGTATFSDYANKVSASYNFWLGDAFASGGAAGYDHKKMAITAKGGWISVISHFMEMGIDIHNQDFTVVGVGDMSGDVFGNAMLLSDNIRLIAAFNHLHIFIDPNPNSKVSFVERKRLFNLSVSGWGDYNPELISKGGGVFDRKAKLINLSEEIRQALNIEDEQITPDNLIKKILSAEVDLLWNGGIGTYVKQTAESHFQVGDKTNDLVRINGNDLRCKAVGEGGNLGFTQLGRIEYARNGGRINTDAIDNSAGVDCSDHEVNIKIAMFAALAQGKINKEERDKILCEMTDEVAKLVLRDNKLQTQAITIAELQGNATLEMNARLINKLESINLLNREVEFLPSNQELARLQSTKMGLTRPEIAILLSYSKIALYNDLLDSDLPNDPYCHQDLVNYFPKLMHKKFAQEIDSHRLRKEIIATSITNQMVNRIGTFFYNFVIENTGVQGSDVARAYIITKEALGLEAVWEEIEDLERNISVNHRVELFTNINKLVNRYVFWLLKHHEQNLDISNTIAILKPAIGQIITNVESLITGASEVKYRERLSYYGSSGLSEGLSKKIATFSVLSPSFDIISIAHKHNLDILRVARLYFKTGSRFKFDWLRSSIDKISVNNYWDRLSLKSLKDDLYDQQRIFTNDIISKTDLNDNSLDKWCEKNQRKVNAYDAFINDLHEIETLDASMIVVAAKRIGLLIS